MAAFRFSVWNQSSTSIDIAAGGLELASESLIMGQARLFAGSIIRNLKFEI